jgi:malic enzyme
MQHLDAKPSDLERYIYLIGLADRNETLFYRTLMSDPARFVPIVYDPTIAEACLTFGHIYRRSRGMYITRDMKGRIAQVLRNWASRDVRFICVSTGGRILGLGDIGANGDKVLCYNDDVQGTASVTLAGLTTALQIVDKPLAEQRILFLGAGSAGIGIANLIVAAMQLKGLSQEAARSRVSMFDVDGLLEPSRACLSAKQKVYAHKAAPSNDLVATIERLKPTVLIGVSTHGGAFNQRVVEAMSRLNERPIIFARSNPTDKAECSAEQAYTWSKGKALYSAGVQFPDVTPCLAATAAAASRYRRRSRSRPRGQVGRVARVFQRWRKARTIRVVPATPARASGSR